MRYIYIKIVCCILFSISIYAQGKNGTAGAQELLIPVGANGISLNGSNISNISGLNSIYYNPAGLYYSDSFIEALFSHMNYIADIGMSFAAIRVSLGNYGTAALNIRTLDFGDIPVTTTDFPYGTGETFSPNYLVAGLTYSNILKENLSFGVSINVISEKIVKTSATGISFDLGLQYRSVAGIKGLSIGVALKNIGPQMTYDGSDLYRTAIDTNSRSENQIYKIDAAGFDLPSTVDIGIGYQNQVFDKVNASILTAVSTSQYANDEYKFGAELNYDEMFFLRGGYSITMKNVPDDQKLFGPTFGVGLKIKEGFNLNIEYAYRTAKYFNANHVFQVIFGF
jgi:hypothetical protein